VDVGSFTLHNLLYPTFLCKLLIVLSLLQHLYQLFGSNQVIQDNYIFAVTFDEVILFLGLLQQHGQQLDEGVGALG